MKETVGIRLFTTISAPWLPYACMMIRSVRERTEGDVVYRILHEDIPEEAQRLVKHWASEREIDLDFVLFEKTRLPDSVVRLMASAPFSTHPRYTAVKTWGRYLGKYVLPDAFSRSVYADVDMVALKDLSPLMDMSLNGRSIGAVSYPLDHVGAELGLRDKQYVNNGLIVFEQSTFDATACISRMLKAFANKRLRFNAQCAFNVAMAGQIHLLDSSWNVQGEMRGYGLQLETGGYDGWKLVHFTGDQKPWHFLSDDELRPLVKKYIKESPYPDAWEPDRTLSKNVYRLARRMRRRFRRWGI